MVSITEPQSYEEFGNQRAVHGCCAVDSASSAKSHVAQQITAVGRQRVRRQPTLDRQVIEVAGYLSLKGCDHPSTLGQDVGGMA